jgi:hypothetical protein
VETEDNETIRKERKLLTAILLTPNTKAITHFLLQIIYPANTTERQSKGKKAEIT